MEWLTQHWVEVIAALYALECFLAFVVKFTPFTWDDNVVGWFGKLLRQFFPKA